MGLMTGLAFASFFPLLSLFIIRKLDFYQTGRFRLILMSLGGGLVAYLLASFTYKFLEGLKLADGNTIILTYAPIYEEVFKGLVLLIMIKRYQVTYSVDGALYGFAAGIGFAICENFDYIFTNPANAAEISAYRVLSANLVHASGSAIVGIALGMVHLRRSSLRWLALALGLFLAIWQHLFYNKISFERPSFMVAIGTGLLGGAFVSIAMQIGKKQARRWIKEKLGMDERITRAEIAAVDHLVSTKDLLLPVYERFGAEKARQVEKLLYLEARMGLKRKALDNSPSEGTWRNAVEAEIKEMRTEIKRMHRAIGIYAMLFVRGLFTGEMVSVWDRIQAKIQERSALTGDQKGGGLWSTLEGRLKPQADPERLE